LPAALTCAVPAATPVLVIVICVMAGVVCPAPGLRRPGSLMPPGPGGQVPVVAL
jgi:hypothetical protein